jgi:molybdopterin-guanine dinucleotide biosynthesis protein A
MVLVAAVDLPCWSVSVWRRLMVEVRGGVGCVPVSGGERQPLAAIYPATALRELEEVVCSGERRVRIWVERCLARGLVREVAMPAEWAAGFSNMNTPSEYAAIAACGADEF